LSEDKTTMAHDFSNLTVIDHPLVQHKLTWLRSQDTNTESFRSLLREVSQMLAYEATRDLPTQLQTITTPITTYDAPVISGKKLCLVSIRRAGNGMVDGLLALLPLARVGHIGLYRDPETLEPVEYYFKVPVDIAERQVIVVDPMLATGNSAVAAIDRIKECGCLSIKLLCLLAAPEGVANMAKHHPDVPIVTASLDSHLNEHGYIVPGLGDAGDRIYGTV
jgi:uracil phosphoribosyltransferase